MRYLHVESPRSAPSYVDCEVLGGWVHEHIRRDLGVFLPEDDAAHLYPDAVAAWRAHNDENGDGWQDLVEEIERNIHEEAEKAGWLEP